MHSEDAEQPKPSGSAWPDEKGITDFQEADHNPSEWKTISPGNQNLRRNNVKRRTGQRAPNARPVPPARAKALGDTREEVGDAEMQLEHTPVQAKKLRILRLDVPQARV